MSESLTEEQMREALFGTPVEAKAPEPEASVGQYVPTKARSKKLEEPKQSVSQSLFPKLRVTIHASKVFEGEVETLVHDSRSLSTLVAEQEAKDIAKKRKFKYIQVVSVVRV